MNKISLFAFFLLAYVAMSQDSESVYSSCLASNCINYNTSCQNDPVCSTAVSCLNNCENGVVCMSPCLTPAFNSIIFLELRVCDEQCAMQALSVTQFDNCENQICANYLSTCLANTNCSAAVNCDCEIDVYMNQCLGHCYLGQDKVFQDFDNCLYSCEKSMI